MAQQSTDWPVVDLALHMIQAAPVAPAFARAQSVTSAACSSSVLRRFCPLEVQPRGRRPGRCSSPAGSGAPLNPRRHVAHLVRVAPELRVVSRREVTRGDPAAPVGHRARLNQAEPKGSWLNIQQIQKLKNNKTLTGRRAHVAVSGWRVCGGWSTRERVIT